MDKINAEKEKLQKALDKYHDTGKAGKSIKDLIKEVDNKEAKIDELYIQIADLEGLQTEMTTEQNEIGQAFEQNRARIKELEDIINQQKERIAELSTGLNAQKLKAYDDFVSQLQNQLNDAKSQLANSERLRSEQAGSIEKFETLLMQVTSQIEQQEAAQVARQQQVPAQPRMPQMQIPPAPQIPGQIAPPQSAPSQPAPALPADVQFPKSTEIQVISLLDKIAQIGRSGITGQEIGMQMEQIRAKIVEIYQWHPVLFEVAAFARRLKATPIGVALDATTLGSLLEQVEGWKARILG
jgi:hypothetical protein